MDRKAIMLKNPADWSEEEQAFVIRDTNNSLKLDDEILEQPPQDPDWKPDPDEVIESIDE